MANSSDPIASTIVHSTGTVVATCSGQRSLRQVEVSDVDSDGSSSEEDDDESHLSSTSSHYSKESAQKRFDNSVKIWSL